MPERGVVPSGREAGAPVPVDRSGDRAPRGQAVLVASAAALLTLVSASATVTAGLPPRAVSVLAPVSGAALAAVVIGRSPAALGVLAGFLAHGLLFAPAGGTLPLALLAAAGGALQAWVGALLLRRLAGDLPPARVGGVLAATLVLALVTWVQPLAVAAGQPGTALAGVALRLWIGGVAGALLVTPGLVTAGRRLAGQRVAEPLVWPLASALVGLSVFSAAMSWTYRSRDLLARLEADGGEMVGVVRAAIERNQDALAALQGLLDASGDVDQEAFRRFATPILQGLPSTRALVWAPRVRAEERARFEEAFRQGGAPGFTIIETGPTGSLVPAAPREEHFPATTFEPFERNRRLLGFDEGFEAERLGTIRRARDGGAPALSPPLLLPSAPGDAGALLLFRPVYRGGGVPPTVEERRRAFRGVAFSVLVAGELARNALASINAHDIELAVLDVTGGGARPLAFLPSTSGRRSLPREGEAGQRPGADGAPRVAFSLDVYGRAWQVVARPGPADSATLVGVGPWLRLASGLAAAAVFLVYGAARRRGEVRLLEAEQKYRALVEKSPAIVYLDEVGGRWRYLSPRLQELLGYAPDEFLDGRVVWLDRVHEDDRERVRTSTRLAQQEGATVRLEYRMLGRDDRVVWVRDDAEVTRDPVSGKWLLRGVLTDVTDRKRAEIERQALLEIMRGLAEAPDPGEFLGLVRQALRPVLPADALVVLINDPATGLLEPLHGTGPQDRGRSVAGLGLRLAERVLRAGRPLIASPDAVAGLEKEGAVAEGAPRPASWLGVPLRRGDRSLGVMAVEAGGAPGRYTERDQAFLVSVAAQVAIALERGRVERSLRENETRLVEAQRMAHLGVWELHVPTGRLTLSDEAFRILGAEPGTVVPTVAWLQEAVHPDDRRRVTEAFEASFSSEAPHELDHRLLRADGRVRWVKARWRGEPGPDGRAVLVTGTMQDLTDQLLAREAEALAEAKDAAESANRAKSVFLASMTHEIRTPMHAIFGFSQLLLGDPGLSARHREQVEAIVRSGGRLLDLIDDVLEMSKVEAGRTAVEVAEADLHALLDGLAARFGEKAREKGLSFELRAAEALPARVLTDDRKLNRILGNLVGNAVKFTAAGGVTVRAAAEPPQGPLVRLRVDVEDTGPGIAAEDLPRLFQRFEQTRVGQEASTGTGLGLALSRALARLMGGDILASSREGEGSVFSLVLPVVPVEAGEAEGGRPRRCDAARAASPDVEASPVHGPLREAIAAAVLSAELDRVLGLAAELADTDPAAAAVVRGLAERFEYDRLLAYLGEGG